MDDFDDCRRQKVICIHICRYNNIFWSVCGRVIVTALLCATSSHLTVVIIILFSQSSAVCIQGSPKNSKPLTVNHMKLC